MITEEQYQKLKKMIWGLYVLIFISFLLTLSGCNVYNVDYSEIESMLQEQCMHSPEDFGYLRRVFSENDLTVIAPAEYCNDLFKGGSNEI